MQQRRDTFHGVASPSSLPSTLARDDQGTDTLPLLIRPTKVLRGLDRMGVRRPHVRAGNLKAVALSDPAQRGEPGGQRETGIPVQEITRSAPQRFRIAG